MNAVIQAPIPWLKLYSICHNSPDKLVVFGHNSQSKAGSIGSNSPGTFSHTGPDFLFKSLVAQSPIPQVKLWVKPMVETWFWVNLMVQVQIPLGKATGTGLKPLGKAGGISSDLLCKD